MRNEWVSFVVGCVVAAAACSSSSSSNAPDAGAVEPLVTSKVIGPRGGTLVSADGVMTISVSPGAVAADTTFTIQVIDAPADAVRVGKVYDLAPHDVEFRAPVDISYSYAGVALGPAVESRLILVVRDETLGAWVGATPVALDMSAKTVAGPRWRFSEYALADDMLARNVHAGEVKFVSVGETLYVSESGNDGHSGSEMAPLATLDKARRRLTAGRWEVLTQGGGKTIVAYDKVKQIHLGRGTFGGGGASFPVGISGESVETTRITGGLFASGRASLFEKLTATFVRTDETDAELRDMRVEGFAPPIILDGVRAGTSISEEVYPADRKLPRLTLTRVTVIGSGREGTTCVVGENAILTVDASTIRGCETGIALVRGNVAAPSGSRIVNSTIRDNTEVGVLVDDGITDADLHGNTIVANRVGLIVRNADISMHAPGGNTISCNRFGDVRARRALNAGNTRWDHVPPRSNLGADPFDNDIEGPITFEGASLAPEPCARPGHCRADTPLPAHAIFGNEQVCTKTASGGLDCDGPATPICDVSIPSRATTAECPTESAVIAELPVLSDAGGPASLAISTPANVCLATLDAATLQYRTTYGVTAPLLADTSCDAKDDLLGMVLASISSPPPEPFLLASALRGEGLGSVILLADQPGQLVQVTLDLAEADGDGTVTRTAVETVDMSSLPQPMPGVRAVPLASESVQGAISSLGLAATSATVCVVSAATVGGFVGSDRPMTFGCARCVTLDRSIFDPGAPEIDVVGFPSSSSDAAGTKAPGKTFTRVYTVENEGDAELHIAAASFASQTNCTAAVKQAPAARVAPHGSTTVQVDVTPTAGGEFACTLQLASDDADESPYLVTVRGTAVDPCIHENAWKLIDGKKIYRVPVNVGCSGDQVCKSAGLSCVGVPVLSPPAAACAVFHPGTNVTTSYDGWRQSVYCDGTALGRACNGMVLCHDCPECDATGLACDDPNSAQLSELYVECR